jgi:hypothetical protein
MYATSSAYIKYSFLPPVEILWGKFFLKYLFLGFVQLNNVERDTLNKIAAFFISTSSTFKFIEFIVKLPKKLFRQRKFQIEVAHLRLARMVSIIFGRTITLGNKNDRHWCYATRNKAIAKRPLALKTRILRRPNARLLSLPSGYTSPSQRRQVPEGVDAGCTCQIALASSSVSSECAGRGTLTPQSVGIGCTFQRNLISTSLGDRVSARQI